MGHPKGMTEVLAFCFMVYDFIVTGFIIIVSYLELFQMDGPTNVKINK